MRGFVFRCLTMTVGVLGYLVSASPVCAHEAPHTAAGNAAASNARGSKSASAEKARSSQPVRQKHPVRHKHGAQRPAVSVLPPRTDPLLRVPVLDSSDVLAAGLAVAPSSSPARGDALAASEARADAARAAAAHDRVAPAAGATSPTSSDKDDCGGKDCPSKAKNEISGLPQVILRNLNEVPLLAAFFMPVTEGVTVTPAEGLPAVTFAVKPTKITRGSGLVAVGKF